MLLISLREIFRTLQEILRDKKVFFLISFDASTNEFI